MASSGRTDSKHRHDDSVDNMTAEIEKLLSEPTNLPELPTGAKQQRSSGNGDGLRIVGGGRVRRFTESVAVNSAKYTVIHENGEWKAGGDGQAEVGKGGQGLDSKAEKGEESAKLGKASTLVKTERLPYGKNSRQSRTGLRGAVKKGGAGGKCVWGKPGSELQAEYDSVALDAGDPNYDSTSETEQETSSNAKAGDKSRAQAQSKKAARKLSDEELVTRIDSVLKEFFQHANVEDCIDSLGEVAFGSYVPSASRGKTDDTADSHTSSATVSPSAASADARLESERRGGADSQVSPSDSGYALSLVDGNRGSSTSGRATTDEFLDVFGELPQTRSYLVVREALLLAFERHSAERELVSQLFAELAAQRRLSNIDFACGFEVVLRDLSDLRTDCPDAPKWTGMFIARAVDDEVMSGDAFLAAFRGRSRSTSMTMALEKCSTLLELRKPRSPSAVGNGHAHPGLSGSKSSINSAGSGSSGALWNVWGLGGATRPVNSLVREIRMLIDEYIASDDFGEALRCVTELNVPHFHHELVYQAVLVVLESAHSATRGAQVAMRMCTLLRRFAEAGVLPVGELEIGFRRVFAELSDLELDVPRATTAFEQFAALCDHQSFLPRSVLKELGMAKSGRKRFMSEADASVLRPGTAASLKFASDL